MKKIITFNFIILAVITFLLMGCKKKETLDTTPPVITLKGAETLYVSLNSILYTEPGFTATDNIDGNITSSVSWTTAAVNKDLKGSYPIVYSVSDKAGNKATATRIITMINDAEFLAGNYINVRDTDLDNQTVILYNSNVTASNTQNNYININNFGNFGTVINVPVEFLSNGNALLLSGSASIGVGNTLYSFNGNVTSLASPVNWYFTFDYGAGVNIYHRAATYHK